MISKKTIIYISLMIIQVNQTFSQDLKNNYKVGNLSFYNFMNISIDYGVNRKRIYEFNTIYIIQNNISIHTVIRKSSGEITDTIFNLNQYQISYLEEFCNNVVENNFKTNDLIIAGERSYIEIRFEDLNNKLQVKFPVSFYNEIIKY